MFTLLAGALDWLPTFLQDPLLFVVMTVIACTVRPIWAAAIYVAACAVATSLIVSILGPAAHADVYDQFTPTIVLGRFMAGMLLLVLMKGVIWVLRPQPAPVSERVRRPVGR